MNEKYDNEEEIAYVAERAIKEGSIPRYLENNYKNKLSVNEFVSNIISLHIEFETTLAQEYGYTNIDEYRHIAKLTGYSNEIVEKALWFYECYLMANDCVRYFGNCKKCGHDVLYIREDVEDIYYSFMECDKCKEKFTYEELDDDYLPDNYLDELLSNEDEEIPLYNEKEMPLYNEKEIPLKDVTATNTSYIFKAATGYRKSIWRKIQISAAATLDDLSYAVLDAFDFDYDHLYAFYIDQKLRTRGVPTFYSPLYDNGYKRADRHMLESFSFVPKQKFLFEYDFGHEWHFTMTFEKEIYETTPKAFVTQSRGDSPSQYPSDDDWDEMEVF